MTEKMTKSLRFVTRFYSPDALHPNDSFITDGLTFWKRHAVVASVIAVTLMAAAAVSTYLALTKSQPHKEAIAPISETQTLPPKATPTADTVKEMKFEDASLPDVVKAIEETYGVKVAGITEGQPSLTLSYRGTAEDLIDAINDLLGTKLRIEK